MSDLISRQAAIDALTSEIEHNPPIDCIDSAFIRGVKAARRIINDLPAVEPRKGKWIICSDGYYPYCSVCNYRPHEMTNYCPNCGAQMKENE